MAKQNGIKERLKQVDAIISMLEEWKKYVSALNECAYSDSMLRNAQENLNKLYDNGFTNSKTIRSEILVTDDFIEDLNNMLIGEYNTGDFNGKIDKNYITKNFDKIIGNSKHKSTINCCIQDFIGSCLSYRSKINK